MKLVLFGGLISLVSTLATLGLQQWFSLLKQKRETRRYPTEVLFNKQTEFYDKSVPILRKVNEYITTLDVWLREKSSDSKTKVKEAAKKTEGVWEFHELMESFSMYLPEKIIRAGEELFSETFSLSNSLSVAKTERCTELLFSFQNIVRECVGVDKISEDLLRAFGSQEKKKLVRTE